MKISVVLFLAAFSTLFVVQSGNANTIANWTFESSVPTAAGPFNPEIGSGSALGSHTGAAAYSSPAGNGSTHSFSSTLWAVGDYYQFSVSTVGFQNVLLSFDQTSSTTGPRDFVLKYSTDGSSFTTFSSYTVLGNGSSPNAAWGSATTVSAYNFSFDLSGVSLINDFSSVYFRLVDNSTTSANGSTVGTGGTDRIDNFIVSGNVLSAPEHTSTFALVALGAFACLVASRRWTVSLS